MKPHCSRRMLVALSFLGAMGISQPMHAAEVTVESSERGAVVRVDGELFAEYLTKSGHLPAVWPIIGPTGKAMTRSFPVGPLLPGEKDDHPHHHSLWFAHGKVNGLDFWTAPEITRDHKDNQIKHREFVTTEKDGDVVKIVTRNDWISEGTKICEDERTLTFGASDRTRWIDFAITIKASNGELKFGETKEGSFAMRASGPLTVDAKQGAHLVNNAGQMDGEVWGKFAEWIDDYGPVDGETVGIAMLNHPENLRNPTRWHARTYGLLAANPFGEKEFPKDANGLKQGEVTLAPDEELTLRYRVLLHRGDPDEADVAAAYKAFASNAGQGQ